MTLADELDQAVLECDALALAMERVGLDPEDGTEGAMFSAFARGRPPAERLEALRAGYVRLRDRVYEAHGRIPPDDTPPVRTVRVVEVRRATADGDDGPADAPAPRPLRPPFNACGHCKGIGHNRSTCPKAPPRTGPGRIKLGRQVQAPREPRGERGERASKPNKPHRCTGCQEIGHNAATCPTVESATQVESLAQVQARVNARRNGRVGG